MSITDSSRRDLLTALAGLGGVAAADHAVSRTPGSGDRGLSSSIMRAQTQGDRSGVGALSDTLFLQAGTGSVARSEADKLSDIVSVRDFGARGDGSDDTEAIQRSIDHLASQRGGWLLFPKGHYRVSSAIRLADHVRMTGVGGYAGSLVEGTHAGNLFECAGVHFATFDGLAFSGPGCTAFRQTGTTNSIYLESCEWRNCHFYGNLNDCLVGNLILSLISRNTFGYFGSVGTRHRHIVSIGSHEGTTNLNIIEGNRFYFAKGTESVLIENGIGIMFAYNNFEANSCLPIRIKGVFGSRVEYNWFENNISQSEIEILDGKDIIDSSPIYFSGNHFVANREKKYLISSLSNLSKIYFDGNTGEFLHGLISNRPLASYKGNNLAGIRPPSGVLDDTGTFQLTDVSGASLALIGGLAEYERRGNTVTCCFAVKYPINSSGLGARLGGMVYPSGAISVGHVLSNVSGGVDVATDRDHPSLTFFQPGTLSSITNAQLSGRQLYVTLTYLAA